MRRSRIIAALLAVVTALGLASASPASASCAPGYCPLSLAQVEQREIGHGVGPNVYTAYGRAQVNGWSASGSGPSYHVAAVLGIGYYPPTVKANGAPLATRKVRVDRIGSKVTYTDMSTGKVLTASTTSGITWWNPASWNWSAIWGTIWDGIQKCTQGVIKTLVSTVGTAFVLKAVVDRALLAIGPDGWAILVVGSCISGILG
jgi:hypothetical protein